MPNAIRLVSGDKILCSHCRGWHTVRHSDVPSTEHANTMLFFECRGVQYYAGEAGEPSRYTMRAKDPFTGLGCPSCRQPVAEIETHALDTFVFRCPACGYRWWAEGPGVSRQ